MQKYIGVKLVEATSMTLGEYNKYRGWDIPENEDPEKTGFLVKYESGYESWCPSDEFVKSNRPTKALTFGMAVEAMKLSGYNKTLPTVRVARSGWNGKGMWLEYVDPYNNKQFQLTETEPSGTFLPWIGMKTADNKFVPWLASQTDILADDWCILD